MAMDVELSGELARLVQAGVVRDNDVSALRELVWSDDKLSANVVDALFMLTERCEINSPVWNDFFIEAVEQFLLHQSAPHGFLDEGGAEWLRDRIAKGGCIASLCEMELLVTILENAENAPDRLRAFALSEIETTIKTGLGSTRRDPNPREGCVDEAEVALLRRLIFASGSEGATIVSTSEADMLFRIKAATYRGTNAPGWMTLFVQGVGNHLMAHSDYRPLSIDEARRLNAEMDYATPDIFGFLKRTLPTELIGRGTIVDAFKSIFPAVVDPLAKSMAVDASRALTAEEAGWLKQHIAADGQTDEYEKALLTFIVEETGTMPSALSGLRRYG
jgi:hypothetical protein